MPISRVPSSMSRLFVAAPIIQPETENRKHKNSLKKEGTKCNTPESVLDGLDDGVWIGLEHPLILEGDLFARRQTGERERERSVPFGCKILGWL